MHKYLVISIDTEGDWLNKEQSSINNIFKVPYFHELSVKYNFPPTYLVTYEIASCDESIRILEPYADRNECEIGHHLHASTTPPFNINDKLSDRFNYMIQSEISDTLFKKKMDNLHDKIIENFKVYPKCHRAGRWAIDRRTFRWLEQNKYLVDSSICPYKSWNYYTKGLDKYIQINSFDAPNFPYFPSKRDITKKAENPVDKINVLEVPATGIHLGLLSKNRRKPAVLTTVLLNKLGMYKFGNITFRPSYNIHISAFEKLVRRLFQSDLMTFNFMFHSNELAIGTSPYSKTPSLHRKLLKRIELVFKLAKEYGIKGSKLSDIN